MAGRNLLKAILSVIVHESKYNVKNKKKVLRLRPMPLLEKENEVAKIVIKSHAFLLDRQ